MAPGPAGAPAERGLQQPHTPWSWAAGGRDDAGEQGGVVCGLQPAGLLHSACKRKSLLKVGEATGERRVQPKQLFAVSEWASVRKMSSPSGSRRLRQLRDQLAPYPSQPASAEEQSDENKVNLTTSWRTLTSTDLVLGATFNNSSQGSQPPSREVCVETILEAFRWGLTVDTAPLYRESEEIIGDAIALSVSRGAEADLLCKHVWTKVGLRTELGCVTHGGATAEAARESLRASCKRLKIDGAAGGVRFHDIAGGDLPTTNDLVDAAVAPGGMIEGLRSLRDEGAIVEVSLGMNANGDRPGSATRPGDVAGTCPTNTEPAQILRLIRGAPDGTFDSALISGGWNLLNQDAFEVFVECEARGIAVHNAGVFAGGLLLGGRPTKRMPYALTAEVEGKVKQWKELADYYEVPLVAVALRFAALPAIVSKLVIGFVSPDEVKTTMTMLRDGRRIPSSLFEEAQSLGLIRPDIDLPPWDPDDVTVTEEV